MKYFKQNNYMAFLVKMKKKVLVSVSVTLGVIGVRFRCRPLATTGKVSAAESPIENAIVSDRR